MAKYAKRKHGKIHEIFKYGKRYDGLYLSSCGLDISLNDKSWKMTDEAPTCKSCLQANTIGHSARQIELEEKGVLAGDKWVAQIHEDLEWETQEETRRLVLVDESEYEYSVILESNKFGKESAGWGDEDKIILFSSDGDNILNPGTCAQIRFARKVTGILTDALNKTQTFCD